LLHEAMVSATIMAAMALEICFIFIVIFILRLQS
jgi:hypothetical protein